MWVWRVVGDEFMSNVEDQDPGREDCVWTEVGVGVVVLMMVWRSHRGTRAPPGVTAEERQTPSTTSINRSFIPLFWEHKTYNSFC